MIVAYLITMAKDITRCIQFLAKNDSLSGNALLHCTNYDRKNRLKRASIRLGLCWLASAASIPIILAHWVLVPGFFIAGPILAVHTYRRIETISHASGNCPACGKQIRIELEANQLLPVWVQCTECEHTIHIKN